MVLIFPQRLVLFLWFILKSIPEKLHLTSSISNVLTFPHHYLGLYSQNLDGHAVKRIPLAELRQQIALVGQEPVLFSGTIRENILLGVENKSDDDVADACEMANARHFIEAMPQVTTNQVSSLILSYSTPTFQLATFWCRRKNVSSTSCRVSSSYGNTISTLFPFPRFETAALCVVGYH